MKSRILFHMLALLIIVVLPVNMLTCDNMKVSDINIMPYSTERFISINMKSVQNDEDLSSLYNYFKANLAIIPKEIDITTISNISTDTENIVIIRGKFDLTRIISDLNKKKLSQTTYQKIALWDNSGYSIAIVHSGLIITGTSEKVKECIDVLNRKTASCGNKPIIQDMNTKVPESLFSAILTANVDLYDCEAMAFSLLKKNENKLTYTAIYKFATNIIAEESRNDIEAAMKTQSEYKNLYVTVDEEYVTVNCDVEIFNFTELISDIY